MPPRGAAERSQAALRDFALAYPGAHEDFPWGESVIKVKNKVFVFLGRSDGGLHMSVKLPVSNVLASTLPFATPTGYGLARSGWVTAQFRPSERPPIAILKQWIDESYRAVAPKKLVDGLPARRPAPEPGSARAGRRSRAGRERRSR